MIIKAPASFLELNADDLRIAQFFFYALIFVLTLHIDYSAYGQIPDALFNPTSFVSWLGYGVAGSQTLTILTWVWRLSLICSALGFLTSGSRVVAFVLGFYLLTLESQFGWQHRETVPCLIAMFALMFAATGPGAPEWRYTWAPRFILTMFVYVYFAAGISKLRDAGLAWLDGETMLNHVIYARYIWFERLEALHSSWLAPFVFDTVNPRLLAMFIVFCELISPLALFYKTVASGLLPILIFNQICIYFLMGPNYLLNIPMLAFFLPWSRLGRLGLKNAIR